MSDDIYDDVIGTNIEGITRDRTEMAVDIYESADCVRDLYFKTETDTQQPLQQTGSDSARIRHYRAAVVCLVLLCVLLLTAVIVLCVYIHTNNTNYTRERDELRTNITNLKEERDELRTNITNLTEERLQLQTENTDLTEEKNELIKKNANLSNNRDQLKHQLSTFDEWIYYQYSFYYMSNERKNWAESRQDCVKRGAHLIVINNREEQDFVMKITNETEFWIGLTDSDVEGTWKWVDGSKLTPGFWASGEPNGGRAENCAVTYLTKWPNLLGWLDVKCSDAYQWICEKSTLPFIRH